MTVDTLTIARGLKAADLPPGQAGAIAAAIGRSVTEAAATKADVGTVRIALKRGIDGLRHELKAELEHTRNQLPTWIMSALVALGGVIIAVVKP